MSRSGDEMIQNLAQLLDLDMTKTAAKKEDKKDEDKKEDKEDKKEDKEDKKEEKKDKKKKKADEMIGIVNELVKMANELDDAGAVDASNLIDEALQVIMKSLDK